MTTIIKNRALGIDIGNVIIDFRLTDKNDTDLYENRYSTIPATEGVFETIRKLNSEMFHGNIFLVSKCTEWAQEKIIGWLKDNDFYKKTGVKPKNVFFCRERHEKDKICQDNDITYFIDDRLEVLSHMVETVPNLLLYKPDSAEIDEYRQFLPNVTMVESWLEVPEKMKIK
ncbi:MAG: hypothetical protein UU67_C0063G0005 [Candidatus Daviesbacteria bacterium GW2011_GWB1_41_5]|uniref:Nucleotidase n=1 Tax=Candidatus Daviesbacteria bacterium GW2011_GWB1_41_5 TaxID=1618429 RepID=A0A0G0WFQ2_9BACT|nr:MAG: hypothetical protein UU67_C0063G0005 [Candidatus Daviesbacteria bacterium GW2011_GWB1_41_5]